MQEPFWEKNGVIGSKYKTMDCKLLQCFYYIMFRTGCQMIIFVKKFHGLDTIIPTRQNIDTFQFLKYFSEFVNAGKVA